MHFKNVTKNMKSCQYVLEIPWNIILNTNPTTSLYQHQFATLKIQRFVPQKNGYTSCLHGYLFKNKILLEYNICFLSSIAQDLPIHHENALKDVIK